MCCVVSTTLDCETVVGTYVDIVVIGGVDLRVVGGIVDVIVDVILVGVVVGFLVVVL